MQGSSGFRYLSDLGVDGTHQLRYGLTLPSKTLPKRLTLRPKNLLPHPFYTFQIPKSKTGEAVPRLFLRNTGRFRISRWQRDLDLFSLGNSTRHPWLGRVPCYSMTDAFLKLRELLEQTTESVNGVVNASRATVRG